MKFILEQSEEHITTHSGMSLIGLLVSKTSLKERLNQTSLPRVTAPEISHGDVAVSYLGLLCQGKSDFDCIEPFQEERPVVGSNDWFLAYRVELAFKKSTF